MELLYQFLKDFILILGEMAPYLLLGFFIAGLLHAFVPRKQIEKHFGGNGFRASFTASLLGVPLPLCSCGVIPTGAALYKNGASRGATIAFMISTPQTGVDSILATYSLMGLPLAIIRPLAALITGISGGTLAAKIEMPSDTPVANTEVPKEKKISFKDKWITVFRYGFIEFIEDIYAWLVIGLALAAAISALIPDDAFSVLGLAPIWQMLLILVLSIPLYVCATGSIPLAAVLLMKGLSPGAAFVLLMAGPATNAATITMIGKVLGKRSLIIYLISIIAGALTFGILIDYVLPVSWTAITHQQVLHTHHLHQLSWLQILSAILLSLFILYAFLHRYSSKSHAQPTATGSLMKIIRVEGMRCNKCKANIENHLTKLDGVSKVSVDLNKKTVHIEGEDFQLPQIIQILKELGYTPRE